MRNSYIEKYLFQDLEQLNFTFYPDMNDMAVCRELNWLFKENENLVTQVVSLNAGKDYQIRYFSRWP